MLKNYAVSAPKNWGLKTKAIALAVALGTLPVIAIGATAYYFANRSITNRVLESEKTSAIALADKVNSFMFERYGDIQHLATLPILSDPSVIKFTTYQQKQAALDRFVKVYRIYDSIAVADLKGNTIIQSSGEPVTGLGERDYFKEVLKTNRPAIVNPRASALTGEFSIFVAAPVKDINTGKTIAIIRSRLPVTYLDERIKTIGLGQISYHIIDATGKLFIGNDPNDIGREARELYPLFPQVKASQLAVAQVAVNQIDRVEKIAAIAPTKKLEEIPNLNWTVILDLDTTIAFKAQRELLTTILIGTILTALIVSAIAAFLANRATQSINNIIDVVASSSSEIATTVEQQEYTANQQAASVNQTTATMDELNATSRQSAAQAEAAATSARQVLNLVDSSAVTDESLVTESSLRDKVGQIAEQIIRLSEQMGQIYSITNLVGDIANQTNMLALNAAVEAARAGEQGKGFAVIATEIRKLADQSRKSTERINTLVTDIQKATNTTVIVADEGRKTVDNIVEAINNIALSSTQISLNAKQQSAAIEQVVDAMNTLNRAAIETASGISQTKIGTQKLERAASELKAMV
ncbi:MAG TPA: methyl-accepting chemotaxis protein [Oculatellaceae cyanobacterium]|jgi:methyl-accepting chemotaxis protein